MKSPFNRILRRKSKQDNISIPVPEEIKAYYQAETKDNMLKIWLLSGATFIVTLLVVLALFWGGRWMWRRSHQPSQNTSTNQSDKANSNGQNEKSKQTQDSEANNAANNASKKPATQPSAQSSNGDTSGQAATNPQPPAPSSTATQPNGQLIDTGPGNVDL